MTCYKQMLLYCDGDACADEGVANVGDLHQTAQDARKWAADLGWVHRHGKDLCASCQIQQEGLEG